MTETSRWTAIKTIIVGKSLSNEHRHRGPDHRGPLTFNDKAAVIGKMSNERTAGPRPAKPYRRPTSRFRSRPCETADSHQLSPTVRRKRYRPLSLSEGQIYVWRFLSRKFAPANKTCLARRRINRVESLLMTGSGDASVRRGRPNIKRPDLLPVGPPPSVPSHCEQTGGAGPTLSSEYNWRRAI